MDAKTSPSSKDRFDASKTSKQFAILPPEIRDNTVAEEYH